MSIPQVSTPPTGHQPPPPSPQVDSLQLIHPFINLLFLLLRVFDALTETKLALLVRSFSEVLSIGNDGGGAPARRRRISILDASEPRPAVFRPALEETC